MVIYASRCFNKTLWILVLKGSMHLIQFSDPPPAGTDYRGRLVAITGFIFFLWAPKKMWKRIRFEVMKLWKKVGFTSLSEKITSPLYQKCCWEYCIWHLKYAWDLCTTSSIICWFSYKWGPRASFLACEHGQMQSAKTEKQWLKVMDAIFLRIARDLICLEQATAHKNR